MIEFAQNIIEQIGYSGIALLVFIENVFPPIPSEVVLPFSGFVAKRGDLTLLGVVIAGTIGAVLGAFPLYYLGRWLGQNRLMRLAEDYGMYFGIQTGDMERAFQWMQDRGQIAVFVCRMVPGLRSLISIPAGVAKMNLLSFTLWTTLGSLLWTIVLCISGWFLGANYDALAPYLDGIGWIVAISFVGYLIYRFLKYSRS